MKNHPSGVKRINPLRAPQGETKASARKFKSENSYVDPCPVKTQGEGGSAFKNHRRQLLAATPTLFIRGLMGGSIKTDLGGVGVMLPETASAFWIDDESLSGLDIHRGDIALVDPTRNLLENGNLVLLGSHGRSMVRRLTKKKGVWYFSTVDGPASKPTLLLDHPLEGVVVGFIRLFTNGKAVGYHERDAKSGGKGDERQSVAVSTGRMTAAATGSKVRYSIRKQPRVALTAEKRSTNRLSEL